MPFYTQPVFTKNQSARALGIFAAPGHFAASHPRLLADYEDGRVEGGGARLLRSVRVGFERGSWTG